MIYELRDASNRVVVSGRTGEPAHELVAGDYRIRVSSPGQPIEETVTIAPGQMTSLSFAYEGDKLTIRH